MDDLDPDGRFSNGLPDVHDKKVEQEYTVFRMAVYRRRNRSWSNELLKEFFKEDFAMFTQEMFRKLPLDIRRDLRQHLLDHGVYVPTGTGISIPAALYRTLNEDLTWPDNSHGTSTAAANSQVTPPQNAAISTAPVSGSTATTASSPSYGFGSLMKHYTYSADKYTGSMSDNLERKLKIFNERCEQCGLPETEKLRAFSLMLSDSALQYYFDHIKNIVPTYELTLEKVRKRFITEERTLTLTTEWETVSLKKYISSNPDKSVKECLELMVARLQELQLCLPVPYHQDIIMKTKLLTACEGIEETRLARQKVATDVEGVISDLFTSIATYSKPSSSSMDSTQAMLTALFTERRKYRRENSKKYGKKTCRVCKKEGCWSTNHTAQERIAAFKKNKRFRAYLTGLISDGNDDDEKDDDSADAFVLEMEDIIEELDNNEHDDSDDVPTANFTAAEADFASRIQDAATIHAVSQNVPNPKSRRYGSNEFFGIAIDTCCSHHSTSGYNQYMAYCAFVGTSPKIDKAKSARVGFGMGKTISQGVAECEIIVGELRLSFEIHVVDADVPLLFSLADMDKHKVFYNNLVDKLIHAPTGAFGRVRRKFGHPFLYWNPLYHCMYTEPELRRLHNRFGHPHTDKLINLLKRADPSKVKPKTRSILEKIADFCKSCQFHSQKPRRFKFTLRSDKQFNQMVYVDIVTIDKKNALHVVDEATRYQAARWLPDNSAETVWRCLRMCWIDVYLGPPNVVAHDAGKNLVARAFQLNAGIMKIDTKAIPVESANSMTYVERYHTPLRRAFKIIQSEIPNITAAEVLQYAIKSLNDSVGPDGLVPTLLVYGALPRVCTKLLSAHKF